MMMEVFMFFVIGVVMLGFFSVFIAVFYIIIKTARNTNEEMTRRTYQDDYEESTGFIDDYEDEINTDPSNLFFKNQVQYGDTVYFYCDSPVHNISISANRPIKADVKEVHNYIFRMLDNHTENFFGLDNGKYVLQFSNDGNSDEIIADIPALDEGGSYQAVLHGIYSVEELVEAYFNGADVRIFADFELMRF